MWIIYSGSFGLLHCTNLFEINSLSRYTHGCQVLWLVTLRFAVFGVVYQRCMLTLVFLYVCYMFMYMYMSMCMYVYIWSKVFGMKKVAYSVRQFYTSHVCACVCLCVCSSISLSLSLFLSIWWKVFGMQRVTYSVRHFCTSHGWSFVAWFSSSSMAGQSGQKAPKVPRLKSFVYKTIRVSKVSCIKRYAYQKFRVWNDTRIKSFVYKMIRVSKVTWKIWYVYV